MTRPSLRSAVLAGWAAVAAGVGAPAAATGQPVLVDNLAQPTRDTTGISQQQWAAQSFATDGASYRLTSIEALLGFRVGTSPIVAELRADASGEPTGALLTTFTTGSIPAGTPALLTLLPGSTVPLAPNTTYWLVMGVVPGDQFTWDYEDGNAMTGPGTLGPYLYSPDQGATWPSGSIGNPYKVRVDVEAVPEPTTASLLAAGLVGALAAARGRRGRRARRGRVHLARGA